MIEINLEMETISRKDEEEGKIEEGFRNVKKNPTAVQTTCLLHLYILLNKRSRTSFHVSRQTPAVVL
jgi:hypothetical protein